MRMIAVATKKLRAPLPVVHAEQVELRVAEEPLELPEARLLEVHAERMGPLPTEELLE